MLLTNTAGSLELFNKTEDNRQNLKTEGRLNEGDNIKVPRIDLTEVTLNQGSCTNISDQHI